jgi:hypothetical protein
MESSQISPYNHTVFPDQDTENPLTIDRYKDNYFYTDLQVILMPSDLSFSSALLAPKSLLFIDAGLADRAALVASASPSTEIHYLNAQEDAIVQITQTLQGRSGIDSLHIISHGSSGNLNFANSTLNLATLPSNLTNLRTWQSALTDSADILLYGCDVAQGSSGQAFVNLLAATTGADVAASSDLTGSQALGGNWNLELMTGRIEADSIVASNYLGTLAPPTIQAPANITYTENGSAISFLSGLTSDVNTLQDITLAFNVLNTPNYGVIGDTLSIQTGNGITLDGNKVYYNSKEIATVSQRLSGPGFFSVTFTTADATLEAANALVKAITYSNLSDRVVSGNAVKTIEVYILQTLASNWITVGGSNIKVNLVGTLDPTTINQTTVLYQANGTSTPDSATAAPNGPWLKFQKYGSTAIAGTSTETTFTSDRATLSGYTNYDITEKTITNPFSGQTVTVPLLGTKLNSNFPTLDRTQGYAVNFKAALTAEEHPGDTSVNNAGPNTTDRNGDGKGDRAGFSIIVLSEDKVGIELGFWKDRIFAQEDASTQQDKTRYPGVASTADDHLTMFTSAEFAFLDTTVTRNYEVVIKENLYTLLADGVAILSGRLRNYSTVKISIPSNPAITQLLNLGFTEDQILSTAGINRDQLNPYNKSSFIFLGDGTSDASATLKVSTISVTQPGQLPNTPLVTPSGKPIALPKFNISNLDTDKPTIELTSSKGTINLGINDLPGVIITRSGRTLTIANATIAQINQLLNTPNGITYTSDANYSGADTLTLTTKTGTTTNTVFTFNITNTAPTIKSNQKELFWRNESTGDVAMHYFNGSTYATTKNIYFKNEAPELKIGGIRSDWTIRSTQDFNGDGKADLLWNNINSGETVIWEMNGNIINNIRQLSYTNKDGVKNLRLDIPKNWTIVDLGTTKPTASSQPLSAIFLQEKTTGEMVVWQNKVNEIIWPNSGLIKTAAGSSILPGSLWKAIQIRDFNSDQSSDILFQHQTTGELVVWTLQGTKIQGTRSIGSLAIKYNWSIIGSGQYTPGDTQPNLLWYSNDIGQIVIDKLKDGLALRSTANLGPENNRTLGKPVSFQDFDGDGKLDFLWYNNATGKLTIWNVDNFTATPVAESLIKLPKIPPLWSIAAVADFTGNSVS